MLPLFGLEDCRRDAAVFFHAFAIGSPVSGVHVPVSHLNQQATWKIFEKTKKPPF
jgi:hypothetical protein